MLDLLLPACTYLQLGVWSRLGRRDENCLGRSTMNIRGRCHYTCKNPSQTQPPSAHPSFIQVHYHFIQKRIRRESPGPVKLPPYKPSGVLKSQHLIALGNYHHHVALRATSNPTIMWFFFFAHPQPLWAIHVLFIKPHYTYVEMY